MSKKENQGKAHLLGILAFPLLGLVYYLTDSVLAFFFGLIVTGTWFYFIVFKPK